MAISTQRSLAQLQKECRELGLEVTQSGSRVSKTDYILALREYYIKTLYPNGMPESLGLMLQMESPMLAAQSKHIPEEDMNKIWNSDEWIAEEKIDGCRFVSYWSSDGEQFNGYSRNISVKNYLPVSYKDNIYQPTVDFSKIKDKFIIDSELVCTNPNISTIMGNKGVVTECQLQAVTALISMDSDKSIEIQKNENAPLKFMVFDCVWYNGEWLIDKPYIERFKIMLKCLEQLKEAGVQCDRPLSTHKNKKAFYKAIVSRGGEGIILKNVKSKYVASSNRSKTGFLKVKRTLSQTSEFEGMGDTIDAWVSGFEPADESKGLKGLVGSIRLSTMVRKEDGTMYEHEIARISNIDLETRKKMTYLDDEGNPALKSEWYGKVCEIDCQCISARSLRGKHAVLVNWRPDRDASTCILEEEFLLKNVL